MAGEFSEGMGLCRQALGASCRRCRKTRLNTYTWMQSQEHPMPITRPIPQQQPIDPPHLIAPSGECAAVLGLSYRWDTDCGGRSPHRRVAPGCPPERCESKTDRYSLVATLAYGRTHGLGFLRQAFDPPPVRNVEADLPNHNYPTSKYLSVCLLSVCYRTQREKCSKRSVIYPHNLAGTPAFPRVAHPA